MIAVMKKMEAKLKMMMILFEDKGILVYLNVWIIFLVMRMSNFKKKKDFLKKYKLIFFIFFVHFRVTHKQF
jgi:hypothetical protein